MFLNYLYYYFKICGLATMHFDARNLTFTNSKMGVVYNMLLITLMILMNSFTVKYIYFNEANWTILFDQLSTVIQVFSFLFSALSILLLFCVRQNEMIKIIKRLIVIVESSMNLGNKKNFVSTLSHNIKTMYYLNTFIWVLIIATSCKDENSVEFGVGITMTNFFIHCVIVQYSTVLIVIFHTFQLINSSFQRLYEKPILMKQISLILDYKLENKFTNMVVNQFPHLRSQYLSLHSVIKDLSSFYAVPALLCIYCIFLTLTLYIYYNVREALFPAMNIELIAFINSWLWISLLTFALIILTKSTSAIVKEVSISKH